MASTQSTTRVRLTKTAVETAAPGITWDTDLKGYGVRVSPKGARAYFVHGRTASGRQVKLTIGRHGPLTAEQARARAKQLLGAVANGADPAAEKRQARQAEKERASAPTVAELLDRYMKEHAERRKRAGSVRSDRTLINRHLLPAVGNRKIADLTPADVVRLHSDISVLAPIAANRALALLSKAMSLAIRWGWRADNPCRGVERNPEERRERYLTEPEMQRLAAALYARHDDPAAAAIVFILLTGCRRGEALSARWRHFAAGVWTKPAATTKTARVHRIPLNDAALAILVTLAGRYAPSAPPSDAFVFGAQMIRRLRSCWEAVRAEAGLDGLRLHDLRHAYASVLASKKQSLPVIGALLGHTQAATTQRYAHLLDDPLREATALVGSLWQGLAAGPKGEVVTLRR